MATNNDVEGFLSQVRQKIVIYGIAYLDRDKNTQFLADVDMPPIKRDEIILKKLTCANYCSGPTKDENDKTMPDYYVFGVDIDGVEVYIKLNQGKENKRVICMSFHAAKHKLFYPLS